MNTKVTIGVLVIAIAIGLVLIIQLQTSNLTTTGGTGGGDGTEPADRTNQRLLDPGTFSPDRVVGINISWVNGDETEFRKEGDVWRQTTPVNFRMQNWAMRRLCTAAGDLTITKTIKPSELTGDLTLNSFDLDPPAAVIEFLVNEPPKEDSDEEPAINTFTLRLGTTLGGQAYVQLADDDRVYVVGNALHERVLQTEVTSWRDRTIFDGLTTEMARIRIEDSVDDKTIALRKVDGNWRMVEPVQTHVDSDAVSSLVQSLISGSIRGFVNDNPDNVSIYGLQDPSMRISVETDKKQDDGSVQTDRQSLLLGNPIGMSDKSRYARLARAAYVFTVNADLVDQLVPDAMTLISKIPLDASPEDVQSLTIEGPAGRFDLARTIEGAWSAVPGWEDDSYPATTTAVESLLARLTSAQESAELGSLATDERAMTITVHGFGGEQLAAIAIGSVEADSKLRVVFDDGDGVIRYTSDAEMPSFLIDDYKAGPAGQGGETIKTDPDDASK